MKIFHIPAECVKVETMHDRGVRIKFDTPELSNADKGEVMGWFGIHGSLAFKPAQAFTEYELSALPDTITKPTGKKSPSARLHAVLAVLAMQDSRDVKQFYESEMEKIIEHYKRKLEPPEPEER